MKNTLFVFLFLSASALAQPVHNRTTGINYADMISCFAALKDGQSNILIEVDGPLTATGIATLSKNIAGLTIRGVSGMQTLDCNGFDSFMSFNGTGKTLTSITIDNFRIINNNTNTASAAALRYTTVGGTNSLSRLTFNNCSIPIRATTNCGSFVVEDCIARNYTMGVFRFGLGSQTGVLPGVQDMGAMIFRRCQFYADRNSNSEADLVLKRMPALLIEDCVFNTPSKYAISIYDPVTGCQTTVRRCIFVGGHAKATSGGTIDVAPNVTTGSGTTEKLLVESCVFDGEKAQAVQQTKGLEVKLYNNIFIEGVGNATNLVSFTNSKNFLEHDGNIYIANSTNTNALVNIGTMGYDSDQLRSDYNLYYKTTSRGIFQGTTTGGSDPRAVNSSTLALLQAKGYDAHGLNTKPVFNTSDKKKSQYYLSVSSPGRNGGNPNYPPSQSPVSGKLVGATYDMGTLDLDSYRYRTGRYRIVKEN
ncbi:hypothetical protein [Spirosoma validum]|uniref:Right-handed parallel beta-helix repeat-containing protein n=1 Tax=Spirosoma validum TaxID=2771355 RepID=A0A927B8T0_9BACT|nr:hypothetical protein [Spirosoma validum]MBD2757306.1 hypothetical protein [Spirosoma validum]